ncbi:AraC family transcriptional regulator [Caballeronia sp. LjRoot34]|uniref:helix-turn-helix domain-containing protein n=1 Tax=Caballeronia sp. LjRoot34 TaxID=3342325 RepID=UPI003ECFB982
MTKNGSVGYGATQVAAPGQQVRCNFGRSIEAIHLFIPQAFVVSTYEDIAQRSCPTGFELRDPCFATDNSIGTLARALSDARTLEGPCASLCSDSISLAVLARVMGLQTGALERVPPRTGLAPWRQRRVVEFMDANLAEPITLQDIAEHAGLSRMYFAAQFKASTGMTPHAFLLHRRLHRAKELLACGEMPLIQIAFEVGFQTHAHFTTVFRKLIGTTPGRWRLRSAGRNSDASLQEPE